MTAAEHLMPLISKSRLKNAHKILFMTHLAIGDYVYQRVLLHRLKQQYPHLRIDIWIDDCRTKKKSWHPGRSETLSQWLCSETFIGKVFPIAQSNKARQEMVAEAKAEQYELVFFIAQHRSDRYAKFARMIAPDGYVVGSKSSNNGNPVSRFIHFAKLDGFFELSKQEPEMKHISQVFHNRFSHCLDLDSSVSSAPLLLGIPEQYRQQAKSVLDTQKFRAEQKVVFVNHLSTNEKRNYRWEQLVELLSKLDQITPDRCFVINCPPEEFNQLQQRLASEAALKGLNLIPFCATEHFYQLPAMIAASDLVITVETAVMHISSALGKAQIVLMRESARQWMPKQPATVLFGQSRVDKITIEDVTKVYKAGFI